MARRVRLKAMIGLVVLLSLTLVLVFVRSANHEAKRGVTGGPPGEHAGEPGPGEVSPPEPWVAGNVRSVPPPGDEWATHSRGKVLCLAADGDIIWVGTAGGAVRYDIQTSKATRYTSSDGLLGNRVEDIAVGADGRVWFATAYGLTCFDGETWVRYESVYRGYPQDWDGETRHCVAVDPKNRVWCSGGVGVARFDGAEWQLYEPCHGLAPAPVRDLCADSAGRLWVAYSLSARAEEGWAEDYPGWGVTVFDGGKWRTYTSDDGLLNNWVLALTADHEGKVWALSLRGLNVFDGRKWSGYESPAEVDKSGMTGFEDICVGADDAVYLVRHPAMGPIVFKAGKWRDLDAGLVGSGVVGCDGRGQIWWGAGGAACSALVFDGDKWREIQLQGATAGFGNVTEVEIDQEGVVWIVEDYWGEPDYVSYLSSFDGVTARRHDLGVGDHEQIGDIAVGPDNRKWVAAGPYLLVFDGKQWRKSFTTPLDDPSSATGTGADICQIGFDDQGRPYCCTSSVAYLCDGGKWRPYRELDLSEVLGEALLGTVEVEDAQHRIWRCAEGGGVTVSDGETSVTYTVRDGLADNQVNDIAVGPDGRIWIATPAGLTVFNPSGIEAADALKGPGLSRPRELLLCQLPARPPELDFGEGYAVTGSPDCRHVAYIGFDSRKQQNVIFRDRKAVARLDCREEGLALWAGPGEANSFAECDGTGGDFPDQTCSDVWRRAARTSYLSFSPNGKRLAWVTVPESGGWCEGFVPVVDGIRQAPRRAAEGEKDCPAEITHMIWSPDGKHLAYQAEWYGLRDGVNPAVVRDGKLAGKQYEATWCPSFSPDAKHFAYCARALGKTFVVVDGHPLEQRWDGAVDSPVFSANGKTLVYLVDTEKGSFVVQGIVPGRTSPAEHGDAFQWIQRPPILSPDGERLAYVAATGDSSVGARAKAVVVDDTRHKAYVSLADFVFSPSGRHFAYVGVSGRQDEQGRWHDMVATVVEDGKDIASWDGAAALSYSPKGDHLAYVACRNSQEYLVVDGKAHHAKGLWNPRFSTTGDHIAFMVGEWVETWLNDEDELVSSNVPPGYLWWESDGVHIAYKIGVLGQGAGPEYDQIYDYCLDGSVLRYIARRGRAIYRVQHKLE